MTIEFKLKLNGVKQFGLKYEIHESGCEWSKISLANFVKLTICSQNFILPQQNSKFLDDQYIL